MFIQVVESYKAELLAQLTIFNDLLVSRTFLVGERLSFADVSVAFDLLPAYQHVFDGPVQKKLQNVTRWFKTIVNQPQVKEVIGEVKLADKPAQFNGKIAEKFLSQVSSEATFKELSAKLAKSLPQEGKKKEEKPKKEEKKPAAHDDAEEDDTPKESSKDPFAEMPKGTFNLDNFKRVYSNEDTATKAIPHFWENFDAENYSIWRGVYKYPEDLTLSFMSCNLISGMLIILMDKTAFTGMYQRLEKLKKNAFASVILFGTDNNSTISGIWVWKGHDLAFTLSPDWQVSFTRLHNLARE